VDFGVFPRKFAKTEMFGTSVMDMGVGAFIFASAIVSRQTRRLRQDQEASWTPARTSSPGPENEVELEEQRPTRDVRRRRTSVTRSARSSSKAVSRQATPSVTNRSLNSVMSPVYISGCEDMAASLFSTLIAVSPLIVLGFGRLVVHNALNYQTHVTEYGVHWNFPFTAVSVAILAAVLELGWRVLLMLCQCCVHAEFRVARNWTAAWYGTLGFVVAIVYQQFLRSPMVVPISTIPKGSANATIQDTVQDYILYADRDHGFVAQNREGLASVCGFFAVYLCGVALGRVVLDTQRNSASLWRSFAVKIGIICIALWVVVETALRVYGPVSRRLVNFPYVVWIVAFTTSMLLSLLAIDLITVIPVLPEKLMAVIPRPSPPFTLWQHVKALFVRPEPFPAACIAGGSVIMEATNVNFLALFIVSNLLVGLVNHTMRTIDFDDASATAILSVYMLANCAIAVTLKQIGIHLKFW
jgi:phosphatidylinositol glycan class W